MICFDRRRWLAVILIIFVLLSSPTAVGGSAPDRSTQDNSAPDNSMPDNSTPDNSVLIANALVFDGTGRPAYRADVLVSDGRIADVGSALQAPAGVPKIDADGDALLPGLIDVHTHWTPGGTPATLPQIANAYLEHGVTTVADYHQAPEAYAPRRDWLARIAAPQVRFTARISTPYGHGADWADEATTRWVNSPEAARAAIDAVAAYRPDLIKVFADGWRYNNAPDNASMDEGTLAALVAQAHHHRLKVATHTVTVARAALAARANVDLIAHSLLDAPLDQTLIEHMRARGMAYAPTLAVYEPIRMADRDKNPHDPAVRQRARNFEQALVNVRRLHQSGVAVALGTDAGMPGTPHGAATWRELELLVKAGISPGDALTIATANSARALGLQDRGTIAPGKRADLVLVGGRPWQRIADIHRVHRVWVGGQQWHGPGTSLPAANAQTALPPAKIGTLVDDFERKDGRTALDTLRTDEADGGNERSWQVTTVIARDFATQAAEQSAEQLEGRLQTPGHALSTQARLSYGPEPYAAVILPLTRGSVAPADLRGYSALRFELRGGAKEIQLELRGLYGRLWTHTLPPSAHWRRISVPFSALQAQKPRRGNGEPSPWRGDDVQQIVFRLSDTAGSKVWFEVDNVGFE